MSHMIEMKKVSKFYSGNNTVSTGFSRVSLDLDIGEFVVITGESGGGKSTLLNVISGLDTYEEGEMFVAGEDTSAFSTEDYENYRKTYIGNIFQDFNLVNSYTVYQNVELVLLMNGHRKGKLRPGIMKILDWVGMKKYARTKVSKLSGGQKQRVAIARAFAKNAPIIVADEPTGNLDSESAARVMEILAAMARDRLVIVVTHNYEQAEPYATRKIMMRDGRIIENNVIRKPYLSGEAEKAAAEQQDQTQEEQKDSRTTEAQTEPSGEKKDDAGVSAEPKDAAAETAEQTAEDAAAKAKAEAAEAEAAAKAAAEEARKAQEEEERRQQEKRRQMKARQRATRLLAGSQVRLGIRNTFNLPAKFLLLLFIYLFISAAVITGYAAMMSAQHQSEINGESDYFFDSSPERIIVQKQDKSAFTDEEVKKIKDLSGVSHVVTNDLSLDRTIMLESERLYVEGPVYNAADLSAGKLAYGRMPERANEIIVGADDMSESYEDLKGMGEKLLGKKYYIDSYDNAMGEGGRVGDKKCKVVGVTFSKSENQKVMDYGYSRFYVTQELADQIRISGVATGSRTTFKYGKLVVDKGVGQCVYAADSLKKGEAMISLEDAETYFEYGKAVGSEIKITVNNHYFKSSTEVKTTKIVTQKNIKELLGYKKSDYETYSGAIFVSQADFDKLFDQGDFQISVFARDDKNVGTISAALEGMGCNTLAMKDVLELATGDSQFASRLGSRMLLLLLFVILFFIAYTVIRIIMRSRNTYFSLLRILGATQKNTRNILRIELITVMSISVAMVSAFMLLAARKIIDLPAVRNYITYVEPEGYGVLFLIMLLMSLLIASRYSRKIFSKSAMNVYRGEV